MKQIKFTEFRKSASGIVTEVEEGETFVITRHGEPVAQLSPVRRAPDHGPSWRRPVTPLERPGAELSAAVLAERENRG